MDEMIPYFDSTTSTTHFLIWRAIRSSSDKELREFLLDNDVVVRTTAAREIQIRGGRSSFDYAVSLVKEKRESIREIAAFVLGQLGTPDYPFAEESTHILLAMANDPSPDVRASVIASLGHLHASNAESVLLSAAEDPSPDVRVSAAVALGKVSRSPEARSAIEKLQNDPEEDVREWAEVGMEILEDSEEGSK